MATCSKCHGEIPNGADQCPHCSAPVQEETSGNGALNEKGESEPALVNIEPGVTLEDRYEVQEELEKDDTGVVYLAWDRALEQKVAIKVIAAELMEGSDAAEDLKQDINKALGLTHTNIVKIHTFVSANGQAYLITEHVEGETLVQLLEKNNGQLDERSALDILGQVASALDYAHKRIPPVVHGTLTPFNVQLTRDGKAKLSGFGFKSLLKDSSIRLTREANVETLAYMAPEQLKDEEIGPWTDIYALCCLACQMLTGHPPFHSGNVRWQIMYEELALPESLPEGIRKALSKGLSKDPADRPRSAGELISMMSTMKEQAGEEDEKKREFSGVTQTATQEAAQKKTEEAPSPGPEKRKTPVWTWAVAALVLVAAAVGGLKLVTVGKNTDKTSARPGVVAGQNVGKIDKNKVVPAQGPKNHGHAAISIVKEGPALVVDSTPGGAALYIDGRALGKTPKKIEILSDGKHEIKLVMARYHEFRQEITVSPGKTVKVSAVLEPLPFGDIEVTSLPPGAEVFMDGKKVGITPLSMSNVKKGTKKIEVKKMCYAPESRTVEIKPLKKVSLDIKLKNACGSLRIASKPQGAKVFINGKMTGTTPLAIKKLKAGKISLELKKECYKSVKRSVSVDPLKQNSVNISMEPTCGSLRIASKPQGAKVFINGKMTGTTPLAIKKLKAGKISLELKKECYKSVKRSVSVDPLKQNSVNISMEPTCGSLKITSTPPDADVYIDGKKVGKTPYYLAMIQGKKKIEVRSELGTWTKTVNFDRGKEVILHPKFKRKKIWRDPVTGMEFVWVPEGCFDMGCGQWQERCDDDEKPVHRACVDGFWIGRFEVTQEQWEKVMGKNPSHFQKGGKYPVELVSWNDVQEFIRKLNQLNGGSYKFRLPTEAEWEYACRSGGKEQMFCGGDDVDSVAWYRRNSDGSTHPAGKKRPNGLGIYDMSGNVREWCLDWYSPTFYAEQEALKPNPVNLDGKEGKRVIRGGAWNRYPWVARSSVRYWNTPDSMENNVGFRLVREPKK